MVNRNGCRIGRQIPVGTPLDAAGRRTYAAAKVTRLTGDWVPAGQDINTLIRTSSVTVRSRIRQLVRDFPYFVRAKKNLVNYTVGTGIQFQSRVLGSDNKLDRVTCQKIEDAIAWGMEDLDASGRLHGVELERLAKGEEVEAGEYLFVKVAIADPARHIPYALQAYEAEWLSTSPGAVATGNEFDQGVEFDPLTGRPVAYHFAVPSGYSLYSVTAATRIQRIAASHVIHGFDTSRPGQLRGISPFVAAVLVAHDLADYLDATIDVAKLAAKYLAIVTTPDPGGMQRPRTVDGSGQDEGKKLEGLENAILEYLRPGEEITFAQHNTQGEQFDPFTKFVLRMVAVATDTTFELLTSDYSGLNFSNLKGIRNDFAVMMRPHQFRQYTHYNRPVVRDILDASVMAGRLTLPGYWKNPRFYQRGVFIPPGMESADLLRDTKAYLDQIAAGLRSPQEIVAARGRDLEEVLDEIAQYQEMLKEKGLDFILADLAGTGTALANNPAAVDGETAAGTKSAKVLNLSRSVRRAVEDTLLLMEGDDHA